MIYTVGHRESYEGYLNSDKNPRKLGRRPDYPGGSVWKERKQAQDYLDRVSLSDTYSVYGVLADWDKDTENTGEEFNDLLVDSKIIKI